MRVFVTGASGFLGRHLCDALAMRGDDVVRPGSGECDLTRDGSLARFRGEAFDRIFHLAAWTQAGDFCLRHPGEQWIINQRINTNVLSWWQESQPRAKLVAIGSSCAYDPALGLVEESYLSGIPIESLFTYAMTKRMLHAGMVALGSQYDLDYLTVVPSTLYGPGYHDDGRQMHFIFDLIRKILKGKHDGEPVVLWGDGSQRREVVHVRDFVRLLLLAADKCRNEVVNIGAGEEHAIRDFAATICGIVGFDPSAIRYDASRYVGAKSKVLNVGKFRSRFGDIAMISLRAGIEETIGWFLENRGKVW